VSAVDLEPSIYRMIHELTAVPVGDIRPSDQLGGDLGMDSVAQMELVGMFCEHLDLDVDLEETFEITTVQEVVELARRCRDRASA
jgi:acyl carrier protein